MRILVVLCKQYMEQQSRDEKIRSRFKPVESFDLGTFVRLQVSTSEDDGQVQVQVR